MVSLSRQLAQWVGAFPCESTVGGDPLSVPTGLPRVLEIFVWSGGL